MTLPEITIPNIPFFEHTALPQMAHPLIVHFAIALPFVIIILEIINLFARRKLIGSISFLFMILFSLSLLGAYFSGVANVAPIKDSLAGDVGSLLERHQLEGVYIFYASLLLLAIKLLSVMVRKIGVKILFILFLMVFTMILSNVALKGTKLVYNYGVICQKAKESIKTSSPATTTKAPAQTSAPKTSTTESNTLAPKAPQEKSSQKEHNEQNSTEKAQ